jgi:hypothetical protein
MDALKERGKMAATIVVGSVMMLFIAGLIEGIFRQTVTDINVRYAVAGSTALVWILYFGFVGRGRDRALREAKAEDAADAEVIEHQLVQSNLAAKSMHMSAATVEKAAMSMHMPAMTAGMSQSWKAVKEKRR